MYYTADCKKQARVYRFPEKAMLNLPNDESIRKQSSLPDANFTSETYVSQFCHIIINNVSTTMFPSLARSLQ